MAMTMTNEEPHGEIFGTKVIPGSLTGLSHLSCFSFNKKLEVQY